MGVVITGTLPCKRVVVSVFKRGKVRMSKRGLCSGWVDWGPQHPQTILIDKKRHGKI